MEARLILLKLQRFLRIDRKLKIAKNAKKGCLKQKKVARYKRSCQKVAKQTAESPNAPVLAGTYLVM